MCRGPQRPEEEIGFLELELQPPDVGASNWTRVPCRSLNCWASSSALSSLNLYFHFRAVSPSLGTPWSSQFLPIRKRTRSLLPVGPTTITSSIFAVRVTLEFTGTTRIIARSCTHDGCNPNYLKARQEDCLTSTRGYSGNIMRWGEGHHLQGKGKISQG